MEDEKRKTAPNERAVTLKTYVSEEIAAYIKKSAAADYVSVSTYLMKAAVRAGGDKYPIECTTGDLREVSRSLSDYNTHMYGLIGALQYRSELYQSDIDNFQRLAVELNKDVKECLRIIRSDRKWNKKVAERYLREQIDNLLAYEREKIIDQARNQEYKPGRGGRRK